MGLWGYEAVVWGCEAWGWSMGRRRDWGIEGLWG